MIYVFPWILINYKSNLYPFHIVYWGLKVFKLFLLKKKTLWSVFFLNIDQLLIESISIPYCALESKALLPIFAKKDFMMYVFHLILINYRSNLYPLCIVYWCVMPSDLLVLTINTLWSMIPLQLQIESISVPHSI